MIFILIMISLLLLPSSGISNEMDELGMGNLSLNDLMGLELQTGSFLELDLMNSPFSMTVIDKKQVNASGARHITELLEIYVPGFQYMFNKWNGEVWGMRGVAADRNTKFIYLVNGFKLNSESRDGAMSELNLGLLGDIERVEVLRGPAGLVYGSGAIAGIVNVVTKKYEGVDKVNVAVTVGTWDFAGTDKEIEVHAFKKASEDQSIAVYFGYRQSDGIADGESRLWGRPHWPYPQGEEPTSSSVPSAGCAWCTDGNWKVNLDWMYKNFQLNTRVTHQVGNAGALFVKDPWPDVVGAPDSTASGRLVDGETVLYDDAWWSQTESWGTNRRQYVFDNVMAQLSYTHPMGDNELVIKAAFDGLTNRIQRENRRGYETIAAEEDGTFIDETFGEKRYSAGATYLLNSIKNLQFAGGYEFRFDAIGDDLTGKNSQAEKANHPIVSEVNYTNHALYFESLYHLSDKFGLHMGARYDVHTRTKDHGGVFTPKIAAIMKPTKDHSIKLVYQTSANNGSADNYEYNRNNFDDNGVAYDGYHFERPYEPPGGNSDPIPGVKEEELHDIKPEKVQSLELTTVHQMSDKILIRPSISWNEVSNLFTWSQNDFRVINSGEYEFVNAEFEASYSSKRITVGLNHTYQTIVNMDIESQQNITEADQFEGTYWEEYTNSETGLPNWRPVPTGIALDTSNSITDQITVDGDNFLNLVTNISKAYVDIEFVQGLMFHTDMRMFWGLKGRTQLNDKDPQFEYLGIDSDLMVKWNMSLHWVFGNDFRVSAYAYDILADNEGGAAAHSLRWQQSGNSKEHTDLFGVDQRSFALQLSKDF